MKKVLYFAAAFAVVALTSCGSGNKDQENTDTVVEAVEEVDVVGVPVEGAEATETPAATVDTVVVKSEAQAALDNAKDQAKQAVDNAKEQAKQKVNDAVNEALKAGTDAANNAINKALGN